MVNFINSLVHGYCHESVVMESFVVGDEISVVDSGANAQLSVELFLHTALFEHLQ